MTDKKKTTVQTRSGSKLAPEARPKARDSTSTKIKARIKPKPKTRIKSKADPAPRDKASQQTPEEVVSPDEIILSESEILPENEPADLKGTNVVSDSSSRPAIYDPVSAYYQTLRHYPVLTREEEKEVAIRYLETEDIDSAYTLVTSNLKLVIKIALEYRRLWREIVDLIQEGNVGLMQAVKKYDPYRGVRFSSYAAWWVRAYIIRYIMNNTRMVKIGTTQAQRTLYFQLGKERERLRRMGIEPDSKAIAKSLKVKKSEVDEMTMRLSTGDLSLEAKRGHDGDFSLYDTIPALEPDTETRVADAETRLIYLEKLSEFVATLADRDRKIFTMRWMRDDPYTLQVVGEKLGITRERVRQLEARIIKNLREYLEKEGLSASDFFS
ncbi:MAG: RNA polymerase factor sigma-32 [bacterium]|nr:RNA polymerase factor sigma-32 [bacterium]MDT8365757.1 RNA polymerase factor sigma-32 [bacterium]